MTNANDCKDQIDELLNFPNQLWLLGAGISKEAGIPLMHPLTAKVEVNLDGEQKTLFQAIRTDLPEDGHVEHILSHLGDYIALAERSAKATIVLEDETYTLEDLRELHRAVQSQIREIVRFGYRPEEGEDRPEQTGTRDEPIVRIDDHLKFVTTLFSRSRAGMENRPPLRFFTTNYDTLLEDALALLQIPIIDGFSGGAVAYWNPNEEYRQLRRQTRSRKVLAAIYKLHGSSDWIQSNRESSVFRLRDLAPYQLKEHRELLIYPQATKYRATQRDPFAALLSEFRSELCGEGERVLIACGYSFGDEHINEEIQLAMRASENSLTLLAFTHQDEQQVAESDQGLPETLVHWLRDTESSWKKRLIVVGSHGVYHGSLDNSLPLADDQPRDWWTFQGLTRLLETGLGSEL